MDIKKKLLADIRRADFDFGLINKGDKIMVGVSGGKDSMALLYLLSIYQKFTDKDFDFTGVMLDLGFPKNNLEPIFKFAKENKIDFRVVDATNVYPTFKATHERRPTSMFNLFKDEKSSNKSRSK